MTVVFFVASGILEQADVQKLGVELEALLEDKSISRVVVNFENARNLSSGVIGKMITFRTKLAQRKGRVAFCAVDPVIMHAIRLTYLDRLIPIYRGEEEAVAKIS